MHALKMLFDLAATSANNQMGCCRGRIGSNNVAKVLQQKFANAVLTEMR